MMALRIATLLLVMLASLCSAQTLLPGVNPCAKQLAACDADTAGCNSCQQQGSQPGGGGPANLTCAAVLEYYFSGYPAACANDPLLAELGKCIVSNALAVDGRNCTPEDFAKPDGRGTDAPTAAPTAVSADSCSIALTHRCSEKLVSTFAMLITNELTSQTCILCLAHLLKVLD
jgi:hypothetical protein